MPPDVALDATIERRAVSARLTVRAGRTLALVGPNGAGKSTLIDLLAGQLRADRGVVRIGDRVVDDGRAVIPSHERRVALLAQDPLLFPHLTVLDNVAFGPIARGMPRAAARARALAELGAVGCADLAGRRPGEVSGGQAQRVALARALATDPDLVLLDEPLASLDVHTAGTVRGYLAERLENRTAVLVTHDALDIWTLADEVAALEEGRVVAQGPAAAVLGRPATSFLAGLSDLNRLTGVAADATTVRCGSDLVRGVADADAPPRAGHPALALFSPAAVALHASPTGGSPRNELRARVAQLQPHGSLVRVRLSLADGQHLDADITGSSVAELALAPGKPLVASVKAAQVTVLAGHRSPAPLG